MPEPRAATIVIPTRNRPDRCAALVRFLRRQEFGGRIIVADSSFPALAEALRAACGDAADIIAFPAEIAARDKFTAAIAAVQTPYVALIADDDITFPHAIDRCVDYLAGHPEASAAQGYTLDFLLEGGFFDLLRVRWFAPGLLDSDPLRRLHKLVRRYQPIFWTVFRRDVLLAAMTEAAKARQAFFEELALGATTVLLGTVARIPCIYALRDLGPSQTPIEEMNPVFGLLADSEGLLAHYVAYRENLTAVIRRDGNASRGDREVNHLLNLIHASYLSLVLERGMVEHAIDRLFDPALPPIPIPPSGAEARPARVEDIVVPSAVGDRQYIWRREVLAAEPADEITISAEERERAVRALDAYWLDPV